MPSQKLTDEILTAAIEGFEAQRGRLDAQIADLRQKLSGDHMEPTAMPPASKRRRKMSRAGRDRIAAAQRKRWAAARKQPEATSRVASQSKRKKRKLTAAGRRAIVEATKRRWAKVRVQAKKSA
jgi:hypothetical protein